MSGQRALNRLHCPIKRADAFLSFLPPENIHGIASKRLWKLSRCGVFASQKGQICFGHGSRWIADKVGLSGSTLSPRAPLLQQIERPSPTEKQLSVPADPSSKSG